MYRSIVARAGNTLLWDPTTDRLAIREEATKDIVELSRSTTRAEAIAMLTAPPPSLNRRFVGRAR